MRVFLDTEFREDGKVIDLISIGLVREDGAELYLVSSEYDYRLAMDDHWLKINVMSQIKNVTPYPRAHMRSLIENFLHDIKPEFWAFYADYDWVVFCQLWGRMLDLPAVWPKYCRDLKQLSDELAIELPEQRGAEHHALADARWVKEAFDFCQQTRKVVI